MELRWQQETAWRARYDSSYPQHNLIWDDYHPWQRFWSSRPSFPSLYYDWTEKMNPPRMVPRGPREGEKVLEDWKWLQEKVWRVTYDNCRGCHCVRFNWQNYQEWKTYWSTPTREWPEDYNTWERRMKQPTRG